MCDKKVSVIIPAYNSEKYIDRCLESIYGQTYKNIEVIVVDDGSEDNTKLVVDRMSEKIQIKYIYQENTGAAGARNHGLQLISGDYVTFCDSDDKLPKEFIEELVKKCEEGADMAVAGYSNITEDGKVISARRILEKTLGIYANVATCGKLYKTDFIKDKELKFLTGATLFEDAYFTLKAYNSAEKIGICNTTEYQIIENPVSVTRTKGKKIGVLDGVLETFSKIKRDITPKNKEIMDYFFKKSAIYAMLFSCKGAEKQDVYAKYDMIFSWIKENTSAKNSFITLKSNGEIFSVRFIIWCFSILQKIGLAKAFVWLYSKI